MNSLRPLLYFLCWLCAAGSLSAQIKLKLQVLPDSTGWSVYAKAEGVSPTANTITGSGQVTLVAPHGFEYSNLTSYGGTWIEDAGTDAPVENPSRDYITFGLVTDVPQIVWLPGEEVLLFTFKRVGDCPDTLHLIDSADPFAQLPNNSVGSNPGNDISVVDFGTSPVGFYNFDSSDGIYAPSAWNCGGQASETPQDTTASNPPPADTTTSDPQEPAAGELSDVPGGQNPIGGGSPGNPSAASDQPQGSPWFVLSPNPAGDLISLNFIKQPLQGRGIVRLFSASGVLLRKLEKGQGDILHFQLGGMPPGACYLTFEVDEKILQRERFVKL